MRVHQPGSQDLGCRSRLPVFSFSSEKDGKTRSEPARQPRPDKKNQPDSRTSPAATMAAPARQQVKRLRSILSFLMDFRDIRIDSLLGFLLLHDP